MSRGITREQVFEAAQALSERGESVTIANVRRELGDTGSFSTIHDALRAWRDQHRPEQPPAVSEALDAVGLALRKVWGAAWGAAQSALSSERESLEVERARLVMEREELLTEIARLEEELEAARSEAPSASRTAAATAARVAKAKAAREAKAAETAGTDSAAGATAESDLEPQPESA
jgi:colicin import membrane protein